MKLLIVLMSMAQLVPATQATNELDAFRQHKVIPVSIEQNVLRALSFYPELKEARIDFIFRRRLKSSIMQAQPVFTSLLKKRKSRRYRVNISADFRLTHSRMPIQEIPDEVMIGWIGHELGHIMDYEHRSSGGMVSFGWNYYFSPEYVKKAEIAADTYAVNHGLGKYIITTKRFILDHADLPEAYKKKIARLYLSPDVIVEQVRQLEEKKLEEAAKAQP